jgi:hypothetical protein
MMYGWCDQAGTAVFGDAMPLWAADVSCRLLIVWQELRLQALC